MSKPTTPWQRLVFAAKDAQDFLAGAHRNESADDWKDSDAAVVYDLLECALRGVEKAEVELLAACKGALRRLNLRLWQRGAELSPQELSEWKAELESAIARAEGKESP